MTKFLWVSKQGCQPALSISRDCSHLPVLGFTPAQRCRLVVGNTSLHQNSWWHCLKYRPRDPPKECSNYHTIVLISHTSKIMVKILQAWLQQYVNCELPDVQAGFRKGRGTRDQIANIRWIIGKAREFQKNIYFCFIDYAKGFDCVDHNKL